MITWLLANLIAQAFAIGIAGYYGAWWFVAADAVLAFGLGVGIVVEAIKGER